MNKPHIDFRSTAVDLAQQLQQTTRAALFAMDDLERAERKIRILLKYMPSSQMIHAQLEINEAEAAAEQDLLTYIAPPPGHLLIGPGVIRAASAKALETLRGTLALQSAQQCATALERQGDSAINRKISQ